eukprot:gb/GECG01011869.1/.p1 GENE.gb/GECG01011869.1/~~gb/GECG01011869.1/.p1  ORF type:complete len:130 (+),score=7.74 gb/GECG01011869.1/:1-390(+)
MPSKNNATHFRIEILEYPVRRLHPWGMSFVPRRSHPLPISFALKAGGSIHPQYPTTTRNAASSTTDLLILSDELRPLIQKNSPTQAFSASIVRQTSHSSSIEDYMTIQEGFVNYPKLLLILLMSGSYSF